MESGAEGTANNMGFLTINRILWAVYLSLLAVLLPHTAWAFQNFEPQNNTNTISLVSWIAAFAFEASIAALTHKLSGHIEQTPKRLSTWSKFQYRYLNSYSLGLVAAISVSSMANLAHAVEFGRPMAIFTEWHIPFSVYALAFGAVLPLVSLVFARVLSNVAETEGEWDAMLLWQHASDYCDVGTIGGAAVKFDALDYALFTRYYGILAVYDKDKAGYEGIKYLVMLQATFKRLYKVDAPAHDLTDFWKAGGLLREWAKAQVDDRYEDILKQNHMVPIWREKWRKLW